MGYEIGDPLRSSGGPGRHLRLDRERQPNLSGQIRAHPAWEDEWRLAPRIGQHRAAGTKRRDAGAHRVAVHHRLHGQRRQERGDIAVVHGARMHFEH